MRDKNEVVITGANGFIGRALFERLKSDENFRVTGIVRRQRPDDLFAHVEIGDISSHTNWSQILNGNSTVIHTMAQASVNKKSETEYPAAGIRTVNVDATVNLARQAIDAGVKRFIFLSTIKVHGEESFRCESIKPCAEFSPQDLYASSKAEAEKALIELTRDSGMDIVIIRPPLVYGKGVRGNFAMMIKLIQAGFPLPLGSVKNKRSLVSVDNLVDLISECIDHAAAADQTFLVSDGRDLSTAELFKALAEALGKSARIFAFPPPLLEVGAAALRKTDLSRRLLRSFQVDISKTREVLGWSPPVSVEEGLRRCVVGLRSQ